MDSFVMMLALALAWTWLVWWVCINMTTVVCLFASTLPQQHVIMNVAFPYLLEADAMQFHSDI